MEEKKHRKITFSLSLAAIAMFGFGYALVPLYTLMCKTLGINGKTNPNIEPESEWIDYSRNVKILFLTSTNANLPWEFHSNIKTITIHPGQNATITFFAKNLSNHAMKVQAVPSVSPGLAAKHLKKTECFCFTQQTLGSHQSMVMPLLFHLDKELPKDMTTLTLSYTLFESLKPITNKTLGKIN